jgi:hypothetical protein
MDRPTCKTCKFFRLTLQASCGYGCGHCRRYPPRPMSITEEGDVVSECPTVLTTEWCGEWEANENP